ncbi:MAG: (Fe-S)-binding protein [Persicimonas sp.]
MTETPTEKSFGDPIDQETAYCTYCPKLCRFSCPAAEAEDRETATPWAMMRLFELVKDGAVAPSEEVAETFYHCMGCRRCQNWCLHENDVPLAMWAARAWMRQLGHVPEALEGFSKHFLRHNCPEGEPPEIPSVYDFDLEEVFDEEATVVYMPDCRVRTEQPERLVRIGLLLEMFHGTKLRLYTRRDGEGFACCGFPLLAAGDEAAFDEYLAQLETMLSGADLVVTDCAEMASLFTEGSSFYRDSPLEVVHIIEFLAERVDMLEPRVDVQTEAMMLHDSCFVGRQLELYEETRHLLSALCGGPLEEFSINRADAPCCGGPSHYPRIAPDASERCAAERLEQMEREGGETIVSGSSTCTRAFEGAGGSQTALDVVELVCRAFEL